MKAFKVFYTKRIGGTGSIIVKAIDENQAIRHAKYLCFTGRDFNSPLEVPLSEYIKPRKQGFQGSERQ